MNFYIMQNVLHAKKNGYFKNSSLKGYMCNQKWLFYGIAMKKKTFGTYY